MNSAIIEQIPENVNKYLNPDNINEIELLNKYNPDKCSPFYYSLKKLPPDDWFVFGSLTWKLEFRRFNSLRARKDRESDFNYLMNVFGRKFNVRPRSLCTFRATEYGTADEMHVHFLIAKDRLEHLSAETCAQTLELLWTKQLRPDGYKWPGVGTAVVKPYDAAKEDRGVKYCLKREFNELYLPRERDDVLSPALIKVILKKDSLQPDPSMN